jgi:predicted thioesterase
MMSETIFKVGDSVSATQIVDEARVASHLGSGSLQVFATPAMVTLIEHTCRQLIEPHLPDGQTSVGTSITVNHIAPTPIGKTVSVSATIDQIDGRFVRFKAQVNDELELVGEAEHTRAVIDEERFLKRVTNKK